MTRPVDVSVCAIVRDAAATLSQCLESVSPIADEMIVIDTGSTDDSPGVARALGAKVVCVPWTDDFAATRNEYLKIARCSWILSLDADEVLTRVPKPALTAFLAAHPRTAFVFHIRNYFFMRDFPRSVLPSGFAGEVMPGIGCAISRTVRLFPRHPGVRYCYPVHESLRPALARRGIRLSGACRIPIHHTGYLRGREEMSAKAALYRKLGLKKIAEFPRYSLGYFELGKVFLHEGELDNAVRMFAACIRLNPLCAVAHHGLGLALFYQGRYAESRRQVQRALALFPRRADLVYLLGMLEFRRIQDSGRLAAVTGSLAATQA